MIGDRTIVKADPGWFVARYNRYSPTSTFGDFEFDAVIAFAITEDADGDFEVAPLTLLGTVASWEFTCLRRPDGGFCDDCGSPLADTLGSVLLQSYCERWDGKATAKTG
jgi:hypothetical protein